MSAKILPCKCKSEYQEVYPVNISCYSGMKIVPTRTVPAKEHRWRPRMKMSYHLRIAKKWLKRYGMKQVRACPIAASVGF